MSSGIWLPFQHHTDFSSRQELTSAIGPLIGMSWFRTTPLPHGQTVCCRASSSVVVHIWDGLIYCHSVKREKSPFPQDKDFLWFVRWLHMETGVTITIFNIFSEIIVLSLKVWKAKWFINLPVCKPAYSGSSFVSLSHASSWYSKKLKKLIVSKFKMTAKDIMMLPDTSYCCSA